MGRLTSHDLSVGVLAAAALFAGHASGPIGAGDACPALLDQFSNDRDGNPAGTSARKIAPDSREPVAVLEKLLAATPASQRS